jgi:hypothetical protein
VLEYVCTLWRRWGAAGCRERGLALGFCEFLGRGGRTYVLCFFTVKVDALTAAEVGDWARSALGAALPPPGGTTVVSVADPADPGLADAVNLLLDGAATGQLLDTGVGSSTATRARPGTS